MRQRAFPKMLPYLLWGWFTDRSRDVAYHLYGVFFSRTWTLKSKMLGYDLHFSIQSFMPGWQKIRSLNPIPSIMLKFIREHPLVPSWKARLPCCCFPLFCILASYLSCSRSQVGIELGFPVIIFKYHLKWHCILFWCKIFKEATRNLTPLSVFWMFVCFFIMTRARPLLQRRQSTEKLHRDVIFFRKGIVEIYSTNQFMFRFWTNQS